MQHFNRAGAALYPGGFRHAFDRRCDHQGHGRDVAHCAAAIRYVLVAIVLRPNISAIGPAALLPLLVALFMTVLMIANRATAGAAGPWAMQAYLSVTAFRPLVTATLIGHFSGLPRPAMHWPEWHVLARCGVIAFRATIGHLMIYIGTMTAGAATVAPMTYGQLLAAVLLGWLGFCEMPDAIALLGAAVIIGAGLYLRRIGRARERDAAVP